MRSPAPVALALSGMILLIGCASPRKGPLPTLEDYSDGVSLFAERFLSDWKQGAEDPSLYAPGFRWAGPYPGEALVEAPGRRPPSVAVFREKTLPAASGDAAGLRRHLREARARFGSLGRSENVIFEFRRRGTRREVDFGLLLTGRGVSGELRQEGGKMRALLRPRAGGGWEMESARLLTWMIASAPEPLYEEIAEKAGLARLHKAFLPNAARNIPIPGDHMPPGAAVLDYDGDGREDLFVPGGDGNRLYRNRGDGGYEDVAEKAGVSGQKGEGIGALAFDYDNDGKTDLFVTYLFQPNLLYRNRGDGTFQEVGAAAGVALNDSSTSAAAFDYDRDGDADLYVLVYGPPDRGPNIAANNAPPNHLYRNNGDRTFTDVSKESGTDDTRWGLALQSADFDGDGWPDLYIANDFGVNTYYRNNRDGTFKNIAGRAKVLDAGFGMGVTVDDYDGDGALDFYVSNYSFPLNWFLRDRRYPMPPFPYSLGRPLVWRRLKSMSRGSSLFRGLPGDRFERTSEEADVWDTSWSWGCVFVDADMDGRADLFVVNGMVTGKNRKEREIDFWNLMSSQYKKLEKGIPTADFGDDSLWGRPPKRFYKNLDGRRFAELAAVTGLESDANQRGLVVTDSNGDGAPDLFATGFLQRPSLWLNRNPSQAKSLVISLQGDPNAQGPFRSTREALGAKVTVEAGGVQRTQVVSAGYSFLSSGSKTLFFGLGDSRKAERVRVKWPSGRTTELRDVPAGRLDLSESDSPDAAPPPVPASYGRTDVLGGCPRNALLRAGDSLAASGMLEKPLVRRSSATPPRGQGLGDRKVPRLRVPALPLRPRRAVVRHSDSGPGQPPATHSRAQRRGQGAGLSPSPQNGGGADARRLPGPRLRLHPRRARDSRPRLPFEPARAPFALAGTPRAPRERPCRSARLSEGQLNLDRSLNRFEIPARNLTGPPL